MLYLFCVNLADWSTALGGDTDIDYSPPGASRAVHGQHPRNAKPAWKARHLPFHPSRVTVKTEDLSTEIKVNG